MTSAAEAEMRCPVCGLVQDAGVMCEADGALLVQADALIMRDHPELEPCRSCDAPVTVRTSSGVCRKCGADCSIPTLDRLEIELGQNLAAVSDRCSVATHRVNQDAVWITRGVAGNKSYVVAGVADGVSHAYRSQIASAVAVSRSCSGAAQALESGRTDVPAILRDSILDASLAVRLLPYDSAATDDRGTQLSPPATTLVVAVLWGMNLTLASIGDSRGYAGNPGLLVQCTRDDSWLQKMLDTGVPESEAMLSPLAHAISRWVGPVASAPDTTPFEPNIFTASATPGMLILLASDGVWGYLPHIDQLNELVGVETAGAAALEICRRLVDHAKSFDGGDDNASAVVIRVED